MSLEKKIAIIDWTHLIEDYLANIGLTFEQFKSEMTGGWLFGYIQALQKVGYTPTFFCFSSDPSIYGRHTHVATKCEICVLPSPKIYRFLRTEILNPYAEKLDEAIENVHPLKRIIYSIFFFWAEYISTPYFTLHRELKRGGIQKILCQDYEHGRFDGIALLTKLTNRKIFTTFQGGFPSESNFKCLLRRLTMKLSDGIICGSKKEISRLLKYDLPKGVIANIYNPLNVNVEETLTRDEARRAFGVSANCRIAVWHGRIDLRRKGLDLLLAAWQLLQKNDLQFQVKLFLLGSGNQADEFQSMLDSLNDPTIEWISEYTNDRGKISEFLSVGDVYVFPSRHEGFPVAPIEAMSVGLPLLAANVNGISDILENGIESGGVIVDVEDVEGLAENLLRLFSDDEFRRRLGDKARRRAVEAFSIEKVGLQLKEFLNRNDR